MTGVRGSRISGRACFVFGVAAVLAAIAIAAPSAGAAQMRFGSDMAQTADGTPLACTGGSPCEMVGRTYPVSTPWPATSPISGVVVQFLVRSSAEDTVTLALAHQISPGVTNYFTAAAAGPEVNLDGDNDLQLVSARVPVTAGDSAALIDPTSPAFSAVSCPMGGGSPPSLSTFSPPLSPGDNRLPTQGSGCELLVQAIAEPDADGDLFGDESQDNCPGAAGPNSGCPASTAPTAQTPGSAGPGFDLAAAIKACKKKSKKARKKCIRRARQHVAG